MNFQQFLDSLGVPSDKNLAITIEAYGIDPLFEDTAEIIFVNPAGEQALYIAQLLAHDLRQFFLGQRWLQHRIQPRVNLAQFALTRVDTSASVSIWPTFEASSISLPCSPRSSSLRFTSVAVSPICPTP
jgi:hypothetical protein